MVARGPAGAGGRRPHLRGLRDRPPGAGSAYDLCDSTACQVYKGLAGYTSSGTLVPHEYTASTAAVTATTGLGVFYGGAPAFTQFGSSNGGQTVASSLAYQVSKADPYDNVPSGSSSRWTTSLSISKLERAYSTIGTLKALRIDKRDGINAWGGRISSVTIIGSAGSKTVTGDSFRSSMGLRSTWWTVTSPPATSAASWPKDLDGNEPGRPARGRHRRRAAAAVRQRHGRVHREVDGRRLGQPRPDRRRGLLGR